MTCYTARMSKEAQELLAQAIALPETERAALVVRLLDSLRADPEIDAAHTAESLARLVGVRSGELAVLTSDDALRLITER